MSLLKVNEVQNYNGSSLTLTASTVSTSAQLNTGGNISVTGSINVSDDSTTRSNLGLGSISTQAANSVDIDGGAIDGTVIGASSAVAGTFTTFTSTGIDDNASSTALTIDASGDVKIYEGATVEGSVSGFTGGELILGDTTANIQNSISTVATGTPITFFDHRGTSTGSWIFRSSASNRMTIDSSGSLILAGSTAQKASGTTWTNPSDIRLKENITNYSKGISELNQIQVKHWEYNGKAGTVLGQIGLGVIADEIESVLPNTVDTYSAKLNEDDETETDIKKFDATEITWLLVNTCKEQQALIEFQQSQIDALTARIDALETA